MSRLRSAYRAARWRCQNHGAAARRHRAQQGLSKGPSNPFFNFAKHVSCFDLLTVQPLYRVPVLEFSGHIPNFVHRYLSLGFKHVHFDRVPTELVFNAAVDSFILRAKRHIWASNLDERPPPQPRQLPRMTLPSTFVPKVSSAATMALLDFKEAALQRFAARRRTFRCTYHPLAIRARRWLRWAHDKSLICVLAGDKNYGPCVVGYSFVEGLYKGLLSSSSFAQVSFESCFHNIRLLMEAAAERINAAHVHGLLDTKTRDFLLSNITPLLRSRSGAAQEEAVRNSLGVFRFMMKVHKQKTPCPIRRIEVDTRSHFKPIAKWVSRILNGIASSLESVLVDSKQLIVELQSTQVSETAVLMTADLVDFYDNISIPKLKRMLQQCLSQRFMPKAASLVNLFVV